MGCAKTFPGSFLCSTSTVVWGCPNRMLQPVPKNLPDDRSAHDKIQHFCAPPWHLALLGGRRSSRAPGTSVPASGHVPSQHTNETGWHIWEPRHGAPKHTSSLQTGNSLSEGTNPIYFSDPSEYIQTNTSSQLPCATQLVAVLQAVGFGLGA